MQRQKVDVLSRTRVELKHIAVTGRTHVLNEVDLHRRTRVELKRVAAEPGIRRPDVDLLSRTRMELKRRHGRFFAEFLNLLSPSRLRLPQ